MEKDLLFTPISKHIKSIWEVSRLFDTIRWMLQECNPSIVFFKTQLILLFKTPITNTKDGGFMEQAFVKLLDENLECVDYSCKMENNNEHNKKIF